jgi:uncharacterized MAPEG superfamily protein
MLLSQWALLGFAVWTLLLLASTVGYTRVSSVLRGEARPNSFNAAVPHGSERYQRCMRAHMNCVENLPVFATLVLLGSSLGVTSAAFQIAASLVLPARLGQSIAHISSGSSRAVLARFYLYTAQQLCFLVMTGALVLRGMAQNR